MDYQRLFNYMHKEHGVILHESEMQEICNIVIEEQLATESKSVARSSIVHLFLTASTTKKDRYTLMMELIALVFTLLFLGSLVFISQAL